MNKQTTLPAVAFILLQSLVYGFGDPISKAAYATISVYSLLTVRYWIGFIFLMLLFGKRVIRELRHCAWMSLLPPSLCISTTFLISNVAMDLTSPTSVAFLRSTATILTPLLALVLYRKRYSPRHIPILLAVLVGLYLLCSPDGVLQPGMGEILALLSALMAAGALVFAEHTLEQVDAVTVTTFQAGTCALLATICAFTSEKGIHLADATPGIWATIVYLAIVCTVGGYLLQNFALKELSASTVALLQCTYPVMTAVFSFFLLRERLGLAGIAGSAIILCCVVAENLVTAKEERED